MKNFISKNLTVLILAGYIIFTSFKNDPQPESFEEINVERINVIDKNGNISLVISNSARQHPGMIDGKVLVERERPAGLIFFNEEQDEIGGLAYGGNSEIGNNLVLSYDQYKNDQVMQMRHLTGQNGRNLYGLQLWDRDKEYTLPRYFAAFDSLQKLDYSYDEIQNLLQKENGGKPVNAERMFLGKNFSLETGLFIQDEYGNDRIKIYIDENNEPKMVILTDDGTISKDLLK